jgi:hypothetical protein
MDEPEEKPRGKNRISPRKGLGWLLQAEKRNFVVRMQMEEGFEDRTVVEGQWKG